MTHQLLIDGSVSRTVSLHCVIAKPFPTHLCNQRKAEAYMRSIYEHQIDVFCHGNRIYIYILATCVHQVQHLHTIVVVAVVHVFMWYSG